MIDVCPIIFSGKSPKYSEIENNNYVLGQKNNQPNGIDLKKIKYCTNEFIKNYPEINYVQKKDIFLNTLGNGTVGRIGIFNINDENKYITDGHIFVMRTNGFLKEYYLYYYLKSFQNIIEQSAEGSTNQVFLKIDKIKKYLIAVPPEKEQLRIITNLNNLFKELNKKNFNEEKLTTLKELLKCKILDKAISGELIHQCKSDEPASVLINKILEEKHQLMNLKEIKKENLSIIYKDSTDNQFYEKFDDGTINNITDEIPFDIPDSWCWSKTRNILKLIHYGYTSSALDTGNSKLLRITDIQDDKVNWLHVPYCNITINDYNKYELHNNDILIARTGGTIGKSFLIQDIQDKSVFASYLIRCVFSNKLNMKYIKIFMNSSLYWKQIISKSTGTGQPNINAQALQNLYIPIPPYEEQKRIMDKVETTIKHIKTAE